MNKSYLNLISILTKQSEIYSMYAVDTDIFTNKWNLERLDYTNNYENIGNFELKLIKRKHPRSVKFSDSISVQEIKDENYIQYSDDLNKYGQYSLIDRYIHKILLQYINNTNNITYNELRSKLDNYTYYRLINILINIYYRLVNNENVIIYSHFIILYPKHLFLIQNCLMNKTDIRRRIATIIRYYRNYKYRIKLEVGNIS